MTLVDSLRMMAAYNRWMNERVYDACAKLSDEERKRDRRAFFRSIHGTLNHLLLTDRGWLARFHGKPWGFRSLDEELCASFDELRRERAATDDEIEAFLGTMTAERLDEPFTSETYAGRKYTHPLGPGLVHLFNHETHHRGQVTTLLAEAGVDVGATDFIAFYREREIA